MGSCEEYSLMMTPKLTTIDQIPREENGANATRSGKSLGPVLSEQIISGSFLGWTRGNLKSLRNVEGNSNQSSVNENPQEAPTCSDVLGSMRTSHLVCVVASRKCFTPRCIIQQLEPYKLHQLCVFRFFGICLSLFRDFYLYEILEVAVDEVEGGAGFKSGRRAEKSGCRISTTTTKPCFIEASWAPECAENCPLRCVKTTQKWW